MTIKDMVFTIVLPDAKSKKKEGKVNYRKTPLSIIFIAVVLAFIGGGLVVAFYLSTAVQTITVNARPVSTKQIDLGKQVYDANCAVCHGVDGEGQPSWKSPDENGVFPAPPHNSNGHTWHHADGLLLEIIAEGGARNSPTSAMPAYKDLLTEEEMVAVLAYIKTFWGPEEFEFQNRANSLN